MTRGPSHSYAFRRARREPSPFAGPLPWAFLLLFLLFLAGSARAQTAPKTIDPISGAAMQRAEAAPERLPEAAPRPEAGGALAPAPESVTLWSAEASADAEAPREAYDPWDAPPAVPTPRPARRAAPEEAELDVPARIGAIWEEARPGIRSGNPGVVASAAARIRGLMDDAGIGGLPAHAAALLSLARVHEERGNIPASRVLAEAAVEVAPTSPEAWQELARYLVRSRTGRLAEALEAWVRSGREMLASPAHFAAAAGNLLFYGMAALLLVGAVIFSRPAARGFLILSERLRERLPQTFPPQARVALLAGVFAFPLIFPGGLGWLFLFVLLLTSPFMRRRERLGFAAAVLALAAVGPVLRLCASFEAYAVRPRLQILAEATRAEWTPRSLARVEAELRLHGDDAALWGAKGLHEKLSGRRADAEQAYRRALTLEPRAAHLHNNLANLLLARDAFEEAGEHYRRAADLSPRSAAVQFNLSQFYRSQMMFAEGETAFRKAKGIDADLVGNVVFRTTSRETLNTVDLPMDEATWWARFFEETLQQGRLAEGLWSRFFPFAPLWTAPGVALLGAGLLLLQLRQDLRTKSALCHRCGTVMEIPYKRREEERQTCTSCRALADHPRELAPDLRGRQLRRIERHQSLKRRLLRWGALTIPGSAHWMSGQAVRGATMLALFFLLLMKWVGWEGRFRFAPWPRTEGMGPEFALFMLTMSVLYYASFLKVKKL